MAMNPPREQAGPELRFVSLFVPDLDAAARRYAALLGRQPTEQVGEAIAPHPFAGSPPVVFDLGAVQLALYQAAPARGTHAGDVGLGLVTESVDAVCGNARASGARVFHGPALDAESGRRLGVFVTQDRHFWEVTTPRAEDGSSDRQV